MRSRTTGALLLGASALLAWPAASSASTGTASFLTGLGSPKRLASTVPANGDLNPYGVAEVTESTGRLVAGDVLVTNFNSKSNVQGTGSTIVEITPSGHSSLFANLAGSAASRGGVGLTTALGILPGGWVVAGNLPTGAGGNLPKGDPVGSLIVLNSSGGVAETIANEDIAGPWDLTLVSTKSSASVFISNALGGNTSTAKGLPVAGNCTIVRLDLALSPTAAPKLTSTTVIGSGYPWHADKAALVLAPTGLALAHNGTLFVDDTLTNSVSAIPRAQTRLSAAPFSSGRISSGGALDAPLGMAIAPNGDLIVVNGNNGNAVELTEDGRQLGAKPLVRNGSGDLFGLAVPRGGHGLVFADDGDNTIDEVTASGQG